MIKSDDYWKNLEKKSITKNEKKIKDQMRKNYKKVPFKCRVLGQVACCRRIEKENGDIIWHCIEINKDIDIEFARFLEVRRVWEMKEIPEYADAFCNWRPKSDEGRQAWIEAYGSHSLNTNEYGVV
jgi:hypothetical protein